MNLAMRCEDAVVLQSCLLHFGQFIGFHDIGVVHK